MTETLQFNIGGSVYKVSRSLLESSHPNSVLARVASERWQKDPEAEIFMERDGDRFRYVLDYMRDGQVELPITESKASVLAELEYYGINVDDEDTVSNACEQLAVCATSLKRGLADLKDEMEMNAMDAKCSKFAFEVLSGYTSMISRGEYNFAAVTCSGNYIDELNSYNEGLVLRKVNIHLNKVGLAVTAFPFKRLKCNYSPVHHFKVRVNEVGFTSTSQNATKATDAKRPRTE